ncbi:MAG TPA: hypothetical protein VMT30_00925 [Candidatus Saccharimonadia bacterium]|nr:hypothetical protein [Candidatus Saccharimonadia bacterium]
MPTPEAPSEHPPVTAQELDHSQDADRARYLDAVAQIGAELGYQGPPNHSPYELAMRLTGGNAEISTIRRVARAAHDRGMLSDQFSSSQLAIFRLVGDAAPDWGERKAEIRQTPLWQRIVARAEKEPIFFGDPDILWKDIATLYGLDLTTTFDSLDQSIKAETNEDNAQGLPPNRRHYTPPLFNAYDLFSDEQNGAGFGRAIDW